MTKGVKLLGSLALGVWFAGAVVMTVIYEYEQQIDCVKNEGWIKGLFWCSTDSISPAARGTKHFRVFIKGLMWPLNLISQDSGAPRKPTNSLALSDPDMVLTQEQFNKSATGGMYACYVAAIRIGKKEDSSAVSLIINNYRAKYKKVNMQHEQYLMYATKLVSDLQKERDIEEFYSNTCREPVRRMKTMISDGMLP